MNVLLPVSISGYIYQDAFWIFFIDTFVSLAIPSLQLRLTTSLFSNLDSQYLSMTNVVS
jgi:hypothetical protein